MNIKNICISMVALLLSCSGCASHHYTTIENNFVSFYLRLPEARHVQFSSSMDKYKLHEAKKNITGIWEITLPLIGETDYFYIVDGSYYIPDCTCKQTDDFGSENCLFIP